jgi:hypothetical protein
MNPALTDPPRPCESSSISETVWTRTSLVFFYFIFLLEKKIFFLKFFSLPVPPVTGGISTMSVDDDVVVFNLMTESFLMTMIINPQLQLHIYTLLARETGVFRPIRCCIAG